MCKALPLLAALGLWACTEPGRVPARVQLTVAALAQKDSLPPDPVAAAPVCAGDVDYCTPTNLSGIIFKAVAVWGPLGPGARSITLLGGTDGHPNDNQRRGGTVAFSLTDDEIVASSYEEVEGDGGARPLSRLEFYYDYVDTTLELAGPLAAGAPSATYKVRTVFVSEATASDVQGTMFQGDKLVLVPGAARWQWCSAAACSEDRAAVADGLVTEAKLVDHVHPGQGPVHYIPFTVPLDPPLSLSAAQINTPQSLWTCAFHMTDAVRMNAPPEGLDSPQALLAAFELAYEPDQQHAGDEVRISARVDFTAGDAAPAPAPSVSEACAAACARVAACHGFGDEVFGASEAECAASCDGQPSAMQAQVAACVAAAPCDAADAFVACLPGP